MEIDVLIPNFEDLGAQRVAINAAHVLHQQKHKVRMVVFERRGPFAAYLEPGIDVVALNEVLPNVPKVRVLLWIFGYAWMVRKGPRVAISFAPICNLLALVAKFMSRGRVKAIIQEHAYQSVALKDRMSSPAWFEWVYRRVFIPLYRRTDIFLTIAEAIREDFIKTFGIPRGKTVVVPNPLDVGRINTMATEAVEGFTFEKDKHYLVGVGRLADQKNFARLIRIFAKVRMARPEAELILVGKGPNEAALRAQAAALGLAEAVHLVGFQANPYAWMAKSTVFCLTSNWEGLPQVLAEAMVCSVPVAAHACPSGPAEMIEDNVTGVLLPYEDESAFAAALVALLGEPSRRKRLAASAKVWAEEAYGLTRFGERYAAVLKGLET